MFRAKWLCLVWLAACGRIGFGTADASRDGFDPDGPNACAGGDNICIPACVTTDPDCVSVCGDSTCVGAAGESCVSCAECRTTMPICGNGDCDAGETSATCYTDCGPSPWTWVTDEEALVSMINSMRTSGVMCPGASVPATAPPYQVSTALTREARSWSWDATYLGFNTPDFKCDGRTFGNALTDVGSSAMWVGVTTTPAETAAFFFGDASVCPSIMNPANTKLGVGAAPSPPFTRFTVLLQH